MSTEEIHTKPQPHHYETIMFLMYPRLSSKRYLNYEFGSKVCFIEVTKETV